MARKTIGFLFIAWLLSGAILWAHEGHEHASNVPVGVEWGLKGAQELTNIHPLFVHFPIALLLTATAFYFLGTIFKKEDLLAAAKWELFLGTFAAMATVWTGLKAAETVAHDEIIHQIMMMHQYFGFAVLGISIVLSIWVLASKANIPAKGKPAFLLILLVLAAILTQGADLGGRMVFSKGVGVGLKSVMHESHESSEHSHDHGHD